VFHEKGRLESRAEGGSYPLQTKGGRGEPHGGEGNRGKKRREAKGGKGKGGGGGKGEGGGGKEKRNKKRERGGYSKAEKYHADQQTMVERKRGRRRGSGRGEKQRRENSGKFGKRKKGNFLTKKPDEKRAEP